MKRSSLVIAGILIGIAASFTWQQGMRFYRLRQHRVDDQIIEWAYRDFPNTICPPERSALGPVTRARTLDAVWSGKSEGRPLRITITYETPVGIKRVRTTYEVTQGHVIFPPSATLRNLDAAAAVLPVTSAAPN